MKIPVSKEILSAIITVLVVFISAGAYLSVTERNDLRSRVSELEQILNDTELALTGEQDENAALSNALDLEQKRVGALDEQVDVIKETVGILDKLSKTDEELLQKYSKVYFLNEHYIPDSLADIPLTHLYDESRNQQIHTKVLPFLENMIEDAAASDVTLWINSAYRSFGTQSSLKSGYRITYGSGANSFSADQGYSEHQLGTTVDFTTKGIGGGLTGFDDTEAYRWLLDNAHKYGFTLSYPEGNAYYIFEPWHWRFVGTKLARDLHSEGKNFYNTPQREINDYLINIFD